jgi:hypothetical protein
VWRAHIQGTGSYSVAVLGKSTLALLSQLIDFQDFNFVTLTGRPGHAGYFAIPGQPVIGDSQTVLAHLFGPGINISFSFVSAAGDTLLPLTLAHGDPAAASTDFVGTTSLPAQSFRAMVTGVDAKGNAFQRIFVPLFRPQTVKVTPTTVVNTVAAGGTASLTYEVRNVGPAGSFQVAATDSGHFLTGITPSTLTLTNGATGVVTVNLNVPASATLGSLDSVTVIATSTTDPTLNNSAVQDLTITAADSTPPAITISASPTTLWPPDNKMVPVVVSGTATDSQSGVNLGSGTFAVADDEGTVQPSGSVSINADGSYSVTISLQASRQGSNQNGRHYTISVHVSDKAGNVGSASTVVTVPHDQGH